MNEEEREALEILKGFEPDDLVECAIYLQALEKITNLIEKQQKEIEELKGKNKELFEEYNKRVSTIIDYEQGLKEIIDEEDDPDTWAYHAVKKLLEEVGGIEYE